MGKRKLKTVFWVFLLLIVTGLIGCKQKEPEKEQLCHIVMEKGDGYQVTDPVRTIKSGSDVSFTVTLDNNWQLLGTDYHGETEIIKDDDGKTVEIVLHEVKYSESICIQAEKGKYEILYDANGGQNTLGDSDRVSICYRGTHQRINPPRLGGIQICCALPLYPVMTAKPDTFLYIKSASSVHGVHCAYSTSPAFHAIRLPSPTAWPLPSALVFHPSSV